MADSIETQLAEKYQQLQALEAEIKGLQAERATMPVEDYALTTSAGDAVRLSDLFGDKDDLILIHNMGFGCPYCTMWADGFNGIYAYVQTRAAFALASPAAPEAQRKGAQWRGWTFPMVSAQDSTLFRDMGFETDDGAPMPGASIFHRDADGTVTRRMSTPFGPGDRFCSVFSFLDLLPEDAGGRQVWYEPKALIPSAKRHPD